MKVKRINLEPEDLMFNGPRGQGVYLEAIDVALRGMDSKDYMTSRPTVMLVPVGRKSKAYWECSLNIRTEQLEELIQALSVIQEELSK